MELVLHGVRGQYAGRTAVLREAEILIGSDPGNNVPLIDDPESSRMHAKLFCANRVWQLADLGSQNGTFLNGDMLASAPAIVRNGSTIDIGANTFTVEIRGEPEVTIPCGVGRVVPPPVEATQIAPRPVNRPWGRALQEAVSVYRRGIEAVSLDGVITPTEVMELHRVQQRLGLTDADTLELRVQAVVNVADRAILANRDDLIEVNGHLLEAFGLDGVYHPGLASAVSRVLAFRKMLQIAQGILPVSSQSNLNLGNGEVSHLEIQASLLEERVVKTGWVSGNSGMSFRVAKGVRFHVGGTRGHRISEQRVVPVSSGLFAITNQRIAFLGNPKSFEAKWAKVMGVEPYGDGMTVFIANRVKVPTVHYAEPEMAEVAAAICSTYIV